MSQSYLQGKGQEDSMPRLRKNIGQGSTPVGGHRECCLGWGCEGSWTPDICRVLSPQRARGPEEAVSSPQVGRALLLWGSEGPWCGWLGPIVWSSPPSRASLSTPSYPSARWSWERRSSRVATRVVANRKYQLTLQVISSARCFLGLSVQPQPSCPH